MSRWGFGKLVKGTGFRVLVLFLVVSLTLPAGMALASNGGGLVGQDETPSPEPAGEPAEEAVVELPRELFADLLVELAPDAEACPAALTGYEGTVSTTGWGTSNTKSFGEISIAVDGTSTSWITDQLYTPLAICIETSDGGTTLEYYTDLTRTGSLPAPGDTTINKAVMYINLLEPVRPILDCVEDNGDGTFTAWWGYENENTHVNVPLPIGDDNFFTPEPLDRGQPTYYAQDAEATFAFSATADNGATLTWTTRAFGLEDLTVSANATMASTPCDPPDIELIAPLGAWEDTTPRYQFSEVPGATGYELYVVYIEDGAKTWRKTYSPHICSDGRCGVTPQRAQGDGDYKWMITAFTPSGEYTSNWGTYSLEVYVPELRWPNTYSKDTTPRYFWTDVDGATGYELLVRYAGTRTNAWRKIYPEEYICEAGRCAVTPGLALPYGDYTWWVRAVKDGGYSPWSDSLDFYLIQ